MIVSISCQYIKTNFRATNTWQRAAQAWADSNNAHDNPEAEKDQDSAMAYGPLSLEDVNELTSCPIWL